MTNLGTNLEVEVKFLVRDLATLRQRLIELGATLKKTRVFERNIRFDTEDEALLGRWELLRLRQDTAVKLTFKGLPPKAIKSEAKVREELEIEVSDFATAAAIVERLGFFPKQTYEKYRETFQLGSVEIVLDEMPYGDFVELEGPEEALKQMAEQLALDWSKRILGNYLLMMAQLKAFHNLPFHDLAFAHFSETDFAIADLPLYDFGDE